MTTSAGAANLYSDDFQSGGTLSGVWTEYDPATDATVTLTGQGTSDAWCQIAFPSGSHGYAGTWNAPALLQSVTANTNFGIQVSVASDTGAADGHVFGLVAFNAAKTDWYTFNAYRASGSYSLETQRVGDFWSDSAISAAFPLKLRLTYTYNSGGSDSWLCEYDLGSGFTTHTTDTFDMSLSTVGFFIANFGTPAHTRSFDFFFESSAIISPEDAVTSTRRIFIIS
jgi:hypothetical protein